MSDSHPGSYIYRIDKFCGPCEVRIDTEERVLVTERVGALIRGTVCSIGRLKCDGTRAETRFHLSPKKDESI